MNPAYVHPTLKNISVCASCRFNPTPPAPIVVINTLQDLSFLNFSICSFLFFVVPVSIAQLYFLDSSLYRISHVVLNTLKITTLPSICSSNSFVLSIFELSKTLVDSNSVVSVACLSLVN